uniref:uncharacterized protein LOC101243210 isoform X2 n=1 Tax=Ciona intestinalis TaxID=7719 RepID=UPI000EF46C29|nr:uncharacterized protein LOC101243210 isoform X2 [Ciona intestinalis]|eukprot:XP_026691901.1 uncharacterized protein LOC101243210 isoform X2 [Ciona intestinalis]
MAKANTEVIIEIFQENTKFPAAACYARNAKTAEIQNTTTESAIALKDSPPLKKVKSKQQTTVVNKLNGRVTKSIKDRASIGLRDAISLQMPIVHETVYLIKHPVFHAAHYKQPCVLGEIPIKLQVRVLRWKR